MIKELHAWITFLSSLGLFPKFLITTIVISIAFLILYAIWFYSPTQSNDIRNKKSTEINLGQPKLALPGEIEAALNQQKLYRAPGQNDLSAEWLENFVPDTQYPIMAKGAFTPTSNGIAFFAIEKNTNKFKVFVLDEDKHGMPRLYELDGGEVPQRYYISKVSGDIEVSRSIWKDGGPKTLHLKRDAILFGVFESAASVYYWSDINQKFEQQWISD